MTEDWLSLQQKYWEQWTDLSRKALGAKAPTTNPWESAMDHWWKAVSPAAPNASREVMERMMEQGKMFFRMAENFTKYLPQSGTSAADGWTAITKALDEIQKAFTGSQAEGGESINKMMAFWELPYDNCQRNRGLGFASSCRPYGKDHIIIFNSVNKKQLIFCFGVDNLSITPVH